MKFNSRAEFESQAQLVRASPRGVHVTICHMIRPSPAVPSVYVKGAYGI